MMYVRIGDYEVPFMDRESVQTGMIDPTSARRRAECFIEACAVRGIMAKGPYDERLRNIPDDIGIREAVRIQAWGRGMHLMPPIDVGA